MKPAGIGLRGHVRGLASVAAELILLHVGIAPSAAHTDASILEPPRNLLVLPQSGSKNSVALLWDKPFEPENVTAYEVYQNGRLVATTTPGRTFYGADNLAPGKSYSFYVIARDATGARSAPSGTVTSSTPPLGVVIDVTAPPYNARGDGVTKNTAALQQAIHDCPAGGTVMMPAGTFLTGPLTLKSDMALNVAAGAVLKGSTDTNDYLPMIWTRYMGVECWCFQPLLRVGTMDHQAGYTTRNVMLYGEGEIRGGGEALGLQEPYDQRSRLLLIQNCQNVSILGLRLTHPAGWTVQPIYSDNITAWDVRIESWDAPKGHSGDGFDPDSSSNCYLVNSVLHTWDNAFGVKSGRGLEAYRIGRPSRHIRAVGCLFQSSVYGPPCIGSEVSGGIDDVVVRDSKLIGTFFYFKTNDGRGAFIRNIELDNLEFQGESQTSIWIDTNCNMRNWPPKAPPYTICSDFVFKNLIGCGNIIVNGGFGLPNGPARNFYVHNLTFNDVRMRPGAGITLKYCDGAKFKNVRYADGGQPACKLVATNYAVFVENASLTQ